MVRRIFGMTLSGMSCRQIAVKLNEEHHSNTCYICGTSKVQT